MATSICTSCGGAVPDGYAFCPICGKPVVAPAPVAPPPLARSRIALLFLNAALLIVFATFGLLAVVAPPTPGAGVARPTATATLSPTISATEDALATPTSLGTARPSEDPTATPTHHVGSPPTATPTAAQPAATATATSIPTVKPTPTATSTPGGRT